MRPPLLATLVALAVVTAGAGSTVETHQLQRRAFPDSSRAILVFNDQLDTGSLSDAQWQFAATHYVGSQKLTRGATDRLRSINPHFLVLHYRLGQALGHSMPTPDCRPDGRRWLLMVRGNDWTAEWPGDEAVDEAWFYRASGQRVFNCSFGHFLADLDQAGWRHWWTSGLIEQLVANAADGVFADSYSVPSFLGTAWRPELPAVDPAFEREWAGRLHRFTDAVRARLAGRWVWIPNAGALVTTRDPTDYSNADGVMIEGYAIPGRGASYPLGDWVLQQDRALALATLGKIVIAQAYPDPDDVAERQFVVGSFLLIKGRRSYVNLDIGLAPEWFPEYQIDLGAPLVEPMRIADLWQPAERVYWRRYERGLVMVNPDDSARRVPLAQPMMRVGATGGGLVPASGRPSGTLTRRVVTEVELKPREAAVLVALANR